MSIQIPYPPVFRDWHYPERRVGTVATTAGVGVECLCNLSTDLALWHQVELTETDAALLAAALLERAGYKKLSRRVVKKLDKEVGL